MILGLDISTSIIGWCVFFNSQVVDYGYCDLTDIDSLFDKANVFSREIRLVLEKHKITEFAVEMPIKKFSIGKSSASTIFTLCAFNFAVCREIRNITGTDPLYVYRQSSLAIAGIKTKKTDLTGSYSQRQKQKKEIVRKYCELKFKNVVWDKNKNGNSQPWCYDIADSILIAQAAETCPTKFTRDMRQ